MMLKILLQKFQNFTIRKKLNYSYMPLSLFFILFFALASFLIYKNSMTGRTLKSMEDNMNLIINGIEKVLSDAENCADMLTINLNEVYERENYFSGPVNPTRQFNLISGTLTNAEIIFKGLDSIAYLDLGGALYYSQIPMRENRHKIGDFAFLTELKMTRGANLWLNMENRDFLIPDKNDKVLTLGKKIISIRTGETLGYLFINIEEEVFSSIFADQIIEYTITDRAHTIVSSAEKEKIFTTLPEALQKQLPEKSGIINYKNQTYAAATGPIPTLNWRIIGMGVLDEMMGDMWRIGLILLAILGTLIFALIVINGIISGLITNPIRDLQKGLEKIGEGSFEHRFDNNRPNELGSIARSFNRMSEKISSLLKTIEYEENKKREYELALIQEQIKPHFLYNTLDIILKLSQMKQYRKAERTVIRLADYYKKSLSGGEEIIPLEEEIKITRDYLDLQKIRYSDLFSYSFEVNEDILKCPIPKLTLQPLVENSIYHGLKYSEREGLITISGKRDEKGDIRLVVRDNGAGLNTEEFHALVNREGIDGEHFGLTNVHHRLQLFFGEKYGLIADSALKEFTEVIISLPGDSHD